MTNGTRSGPTSTSSPGKAPLPGEAAAATGSPGGDAFLREQADEARRALAKGFEDLKATVAAKVNPRHLPRKFPFVTVGAVAVAGFAAALLAIPSKEQQELKRLERIRRAMYPEPKPPKADKAAVDKAKAQGDKTPLWVTLVKEGVQAARPLLVALVTASMKASEKSKDDAQANGSGQVQR